MQPYFNNRPIGDEVAVDEAEAMRRMQKMFASGADEVRVRYRGAGITRPRMDAKTRRRKRKQQRQAKKAARS